MLDELRNYVRGTVMDIGAGANAVLLANELGERYGALDIGDSYKSTTPLDRAAIHRIANIEGKALPKKVGGTDLWGWDE